MPSGEGPVGVGDEIARSPLPGGVKEHVTLSRVGIVIIGRNEGERLRRCLQSGALREFPCVYVDSASKDGSSALARQMGFEVLELDSGRPLSAARARNEGFERLLAAHPELEGIQFVDGDCVLSEAWGQRAVQELEARPEIAVVTGRLREAQPERSIYNRLCDLEWDGPAGEVKACGGIAMVRVQAFRQAGGFNAALVAGEEPELYLRLRQAGWKIVRIDADMATHDAAMTRLSQWWVRSRRAGLAYAQGVALHGGPPAWFGVREVLSILFWALAVPAGVLGAAWPSRGWSLMGALAYPLLVIRIAWSRRRGGVHRSHAWSYAVFCVLAKGPQLLGVLQFVALRILGKSPGLVEYKGSSTEKVDLAQPAPPDPAGRAAPKP